MILDIIVCLLMLSPLTKRTLVVRTRHYQIRAGLLRGLVADEFKVSASGSPDFQSEGLDNFSCFRNLFRHG